MTQFEQGDLLHDVQNGDPWAKEDLKQLELMTNLVMQETETVVAEVLPLPDERLYELGYDCFALAEDAWEQVKAELKAERPAAYYEQQMSKACQKGCAWCCYLHVEASRIECLAIAHYFTMSLTPEALFVFIQTVRDTAKRLQAHDSASRIPDKIPCSLLDVETGTCKGYEVRPLSCRGYNSMDVTHCRKGFGVLGAWTPIEPWQLQAFNAVLAGARQALAKAGLPSDRLELNQGLLWAFEQLAGLNDVEGKGA